jgi:hypothetical protein
VIFNELTRLIAREDFIDFIKQPYEPVTDWVQVYSITATMSWLVLYSVLTADWTRMVPWSMKHYEETSCFSSGSGLLARGTWREHGECCDTPQATVEPTDWVRVLESCHPAELQWHLTFNNYIFTANTMCKCYSRMASAPFSHINISYLEWGFLVFLSPFKHMLE